MTVSGLLEVPAQFLTYPRVVRSTSGMCFMVVGARYVLREASAARNQANLLFVQRWREATYTTYSLYTLQGRHTGLSGASKVGQSRGEGMRRSHSNRGIQNERHGRDLFKTRHAYARTNFKCGMDREQGKIISITVTWAESKVTVVINGAELL